MFPRKPALSCIICNVLYTVSSVTVVCPADFVYVRGGCYQITAPSALLSWPEAVAACEVQNAYLAVPRSVPELRWLFEIFSVRGLFSAIPGGPWQGMWIGINDISKEALWQPVDGGAALSFTNWISGQPNNWDYVDNCFEHCGALVVQSLGAWADYSCSKPLQALCKHNATVHHAVPNKLEGSNRCCML